MILTAGTACSLCGAGLVLGFGGRHLGDDRGQWLGAAARGYHGAEFMIPQYTVVSTPD